MSMSNNTNEITLDIQFSDNERPEDWSAGFTGIEVVDESDIYVTVVASVRPGEDADDVCARIAALLPRHTGDFHATVNVAK